MIVVRVALATVALAGCSSDDLTCVLLADPSNCFAPQASALAACMPMRATPAKLSSDGRTCTFADGVRVVFATARIDVCTDVGLTFNVYSADGSVCGRLHYNETSDGPIISVNDVSWQGWDEGVDLLCPSHTFHGRLAAECPDAPYVDLPPTVELFSAATPTALFTCLP
jgi:hypothetical protein